MIVKIKGSYNLVIAGIYLANLVAIIFLSQAFSRSIDISYISHHLLTDNLNVASRTVFDISIVYLLAVILAIGSLYHLFLALKPNFYQQLIDKKLNYFKWLTLGLMIGISLVVSALLLGINDLAYLLSLVLFSLVFAGLNIVSEYLVANKTKLKTVLKIKIFKQDLLKFIFILQKLSSILILLVIGISLLAISLWSNVGSVWIYLVIYLVCLLWLASLLAINYAYVKDKPLLKNYANLEIFQIGATAIFLVSWLWLVINFGN